MNHSHIKPLPYYSTYVGARERALASSLRAEVLPKLKRRLPHHHLNGLPHGWVPAFVNKYSKQYKFFLRTDISKFYPSVQHLDLVVGAQIAYRDLLGLDYVPNPFKLKYVGPLTEWTRDLPMEEIGIPLSSPLSSLNDCHIIPVRLTLLLTLRANSTT